MQTERYALQTILANRFASQTIIKILFVAFSWAVTVLSWGGGGYGLCNLCLYREHPKAQTIVVLEKPGIETATPGLQGIALT